MILDSLFFARYNILFNKMIGSRVSILFTLVLILLSITNIISDDIRTEEITTTIYQNSTEPDKPTGKTLPLWAGFVGCIVASVFFGSNLLPVKQLSAGDGFFFQFIFCIAVWLVGSILDLILDNQRFYPLVLIGGIRNLFVRNYFDKL